LLLETVRLIRDDLPDLPLLVRISVTEYAEGGYSQEEAIALGKALEDEGVVALDLSGGSNENPNLSRYCIQPPSFPRRCLEPYARPLKEALKVPVIIAGRIIAPEDAEGVLKAGSADFVSLGRALIADPHWCAKALGTVRAPIRQCISCNVCYERLTLERDVACVANPMVGTEFESLARLEPQLVAGVEAEDRRRILVIGAGVAGMEAARVATGAGHQVVIWEHAAVLGGQLPLALASPDKEDVAGIWTYRQREVEELGIEIRLSREPTADDIRRYAPDLVIVATGSKARDLPFPLALHVPVLQAWDVLLRPELLARGAAVTIIGGGLVGIETADLLVARGCRVTVIELQASVAREMARNNRFEILTRLTENGATLLTETTIETATNSEFVLTRRGQEMRLPAGDAVVVAIGPEPDRSVVAEIEKTDIPYVLVGDCNRPADFMAAIRDASMVAHAIAHRLQRHAPARRATQRMPEMRAGPR
jgi:NADPH-dependent 2,4-dienoyl-CoA reductase/sulfur reductase-like enzyme